MLQLRRKGNQTSVPRVVLPQIISLQFDPLNNNTRFSACNLTHTPKNTRPEMVPVNHRHFVLTYSDNPEEYGFTKEEVIDMLTIVAENDDHEAFYDPEFTNNVGTFFEGGVCVEKDIEKAVFWYERAVALGNDLAKSNLADILRKGTMGYPKDLKRAFELYKSCGLPYAFYRVGEFYENGWGVEKNLELAKEYYRVAYRENHHLAIKKLSEFDFLH